MIDSSQWLPYLPKLGILIGALLVGYVVVRLVAGLLADVTLWANEDTGGSDEGSADDQEQSGEWVGTTPGLHVFSDYGATHILVDKNPTERTIRQTVRGLDWAGGFHQVLLVTSPGVSLEVGGSLDPEDGLSSMFSDVYKDVYRVIRKPPDSVRMMEDLLVSFHSGDGRWEHMADFD